MLLAAMCIMSYNQLFNWRWQYIQCIMDGMLEELDLVLE